MKAEDVKKMANPFNSSDKLKGFAAGVGLSLVTPLVLTALATVARPAARAAIKAGLVLYQRGREKVAEVGEVIEDLVAEAQAELDESHAESHETIVEAEESISPTRKDSKPTSPEGEA
jgi:hypothetical protein